jgi:uncharacterized repeat protein (TIGR03843 family)
VGRTLEDRLATAPLEVVGRFTDASNATLLVRLLDRERRTLAELSETLGRAAELDDLDPADLAVYKPRDGERPLWDYPEGTLHRREVAAYLVDRAMGLDMVPLTLLRDDAPHGPGSLQRFVPHDPMQHYFTLREPALTGADPELRSRLALLATFDLVVDNADRKGGHVLVEEGTAPLSERLRAVDHGVTFNVERKHRTVVWDLAGTELDAAVDDALTRLEVALVGEVGSRLGDLLSDAEVIVTRERLRSLRDAGRLPEPEGDRPFPWPLL